jgi:hypothetical protein
MVFNRSNGIDWRKGVAAIAGITLFGFLSIVAYNLYDAAEQRNASYNYQPSSKARGSVIGITKPHAKEYEPYCQNPQSNEDADLCAQWGAVEQVAESNRLTSLNARMAIASLIATAVATFLLLWTLWETRRTSRAELRAYVFAEGAIIYIHKNQTPVTENGKIGITVVIKNSGQTPAYNLWHWCGIELCDQSKDDSLKIPTNNDEVGFKNTISPGGAMSAARRLVKKLTQKEIAGIKSGSLAIYAYGRIEYTDTFGKRRFTDYRYNIGLWPLPEDTQTEMFYAMHGNRAN